MDAAIQLFVAALAALGFTAGFLGRRGAGRTCCLAVTGGAERIVKHGNHILGRAGCHRVVDDLSFASRLHEAGTTQDRKVLRQDRLTDRNFVVQLADRLFTPDQSAQDSQTMFVRHDSKQTSSSFRLLGKLDGKGFEIVFRHVRKYTVLTEIFAAAVACRGIS